MAAAVPHRGSAIETLVHRALRACLRQRDCTTADAGVAIVGRLRRRLRGPARQCGRARSRAQRGTHPTRPSSTPPGSSPPPSSCYGAAPPGAPPRRVRLRRHRRARLHAFRDHLGYGLLFYRSTLRRALCRDRGQAGGRRGRDPEGAGRRGCRAHRLQRPGRRDAVRAPRRSPAAEGARSLATTTTILCSSTATGSRRSLLETATLSGIDMQERFDELLGQAVSRCLTGHDLISLSGGIDSPAVAAFAAPRHLELCGEPLQASDGRLSRGFRSVDERAVRRAPCRPVRDPAPRRSSRRRIRSEISPSGWRSPTGRIRPPRWRSTPSPTGGVRELGFRTVLSGEHAEFVFALNWFLIEHLAHARATSAPCGGSSTSVGRRASRILSLAWLFARCLAPGRLLAARERRRPVGRSGLARHVRKVSERVATSYASPRERWRTLQLSGFIGPGISAEAEAICQAVCGVQARRPWTDVDLFEFFLSLPAEIKFPDIGGKNLVRQPAQRPGSGRDPRSAGPDVLQRVAARRRRLRDASPLPGRAGASFPGVDYDVLADRCAGEDLRRARLQLGQAARHRARIPGPVVTAGLDLGCGSPRRGSARERNHASLPRAHGVATTSRSPSAAARSTRCSARTAPARRRSSGSWPGC